eukprot:TRINITY_DN3382_c0_g1_i1.p1 TRINITY_DN3382_c0_g1~~TRINITY_DN3382_c0_g1_i1.p1  ORF type:complete len:1150 (+),score=314.08 TRINITY_DN3382_c0_g1_i1:80-3529(+)
MAAKYSLDASVDDASPTRLTVEPPQIDGPRLAVSVEGTKPSLDDMRWAVATPKSGAAALRSSAEQDTERPPPPAVAAAALELSCGLLLVAAGCVPAAAADGDFCGALLCYNSQGVTHAPASMLGGVAAGCCATAAVCCGIGVALCSVRAFALTGYSRLRRVRSSAAPGIVAMLCNGAATAAALTAALASGGAPLPGAFVLLLPLFAMYLSFRVAAGAGQSVPAAADQLARTMSGSPTSPARTARPSTISFRMCSNASSGAHGTPPGADSPHAVNDDTEAQHTPPDELSPSYSSHTALMRHGYMPRALRQTADGERLQLDGSLSGLSVRDAAQLARLKTPPVGSSSMGSFALTLASSGPGSSRSVPGRRSQTLEEGADGSDDDGLCRQCRRLRRLAMDGRTLTPLALGSGIDTPPPRALSAPPNSAAAAAAVFGTRSRASTRASTVMTAGADSFEPGSDAEREPAPAAGPVHLPTLRLTPPVVAVAAPTPPLPPPVPTPRQLSELGRAPTVPQDDRETAGTLSSAGSAGSLRSRRSVNMLRGVATAATAVAKMKRAVRFSDSNNDPLESPRPSPTSKRRRNPPPPLSGGRLQRSERSEGSISKPEGDNAVHRQLSVQESEGTDSGSDAGRPAQVLYSDMNRSDVSSDTQLPVPMTHRSHAGETDGSVSPRSVQGTMPVRLWQMRERRQSAVSFASTMLPRNASLHTIKTQLSGEDDENQSVCAGAEPRSHVREVHRIVKSVSADGVKLVNGYEVVRELGRGSYAKVKLCRDTRTGDFRALKIVKQSMVRSVGRFGGKGSLLTSGLAKVQQEISIMKKIRHRNLVALHEVMDDPSADKLILVLDYAARGSAGYVDTVTGTLEVPDPPLTEKAARAVLRDVVSGLRYLHHRRVLHRDIKPENILVDESGKAKLSDFGSCLVLRQVLSDQHHHVRQTDGTPAYFAPEAMSGSAFCGFAADVWALGVTSYVLCQGRLPFHSSDRKELRSLILTHNPLANVPRRLSATLADLLHLMLHKEPRQRPNLRDLSQHAFLLSESPTAHEQDTLWGLSPVQSPRGTTPLYSPSTGFGHPPIEPSPAGSPEPRGLGGLVTPAQNVLGTTTLPKLDISAALRRRQTVSTEDTGPSIPAADKAACCCVDANRSHSDLSYHTAT